MFTGTESDSLLWPYISKRVLNPYRESNYVITKDCEYEIKLSREWLNIIRRFEYWICEPEKHMRYWSFQITCKFCRHTTHVDINPQVLTQDGADILALHYQDCWHIMRPARNRGLFYDLIEQWPYVSPSL
jgi:hypothetical protein